MSSNNSSSRNSYCINQLCNASLQIDAQYKVSLNELGYCKIIELKSHQRNKILQARLSRDKNAANKQEQLALTTTQMAARLSENSALPARRRRASVEQLSPV